MKSKVKLWHLMAFILNSFDCFRFFFHNFVRNMLQVNKNYLSDKVIDCEKENDELKTNLDITTRQYNNKCNDFENSQSELKKSRREIDVSSD